MINTQNILVFKQIQSYFLKSNRKLFNELCITGWSCWFPVSAKQCFPGVEYDPKISEGWNPQRNLGLNSHW